MVTLVQLLVTAEILHKPFHAEATIRLAVKHSNGAHSLIVVVLVQLDLDLRSALLAYGYNGVSLRPVCDALIDEGKDNNPLDLGEIAAVNPQILARGNRAGAVISVQENVRRPVQTAEGFAERLDRAFEAIAQFKQTAQIEIYSFSAEPAGGFGLNPVEIDDYLACSSRPALKPDRLPRFFSSRSPEFPGEPGGEAGGNRSAGLCLGRGRSSGRTKGDFRGGASGLAV